MTPQHEKNMVLAADGQRPAAILFASRSRLTGIATLVASCALTLSAAQAQPPQQPQAQAQQQQALITPQFRDAEITQVIDAVSQVTGKTFIVDPRVRAQVTILSATPMTPGAFYETFLQILQVHGFIAVPSGLAVKIVPEANLRQMPANDLPDRVSSSSDEIVTQVIPVRNVNAAQLVPILRPMVPQTGHLAAYGPSNMLIVSDHANNVSRIIRIIQRIDQASDEEIDIVRLENASAAEIVRVTNSLFAATPGAAPEGGGTGIKLIADDRTNSVLITGERSQRLRVKALIAHLDTPREGGGDTQVIYLQYADAETLGGKLREQVTGIVQAAGGTGTPGGGAAPPAAGAASAALADRTVNIWSEPQTNALVITAPPKAMNQLKSVISRLDIRRYQVLVEAILVEVSTNKSAELGVNWAVGSTEEGDTVPVGTFNQPVGGASIGSIVTAIRDPDTLAQVGIPNGLTLGAGRINDAGVSFAVLLRALRGDASTNILQTPSIITLDNEEAEIKVAQEVPFVTGQFTNTGAAAGSVNPFQTIQREEVGTILKITPQINESQSVVLKIEQESSDIAQSTQGAVDLITNKRTITTKVLVEDGGVIVLGGLIRDSALESESRVPILGSIPLIGELFKTRSGSKEKRNLMVFIRPTILRDGPAAAIETNAKYNVIRDHQLSRRKGRVTLLPGERQPLLPPIEDLSRYADPTAGERGAPAPGTDKSTVSPVQTTPLPPTEAPPPPETQPPPR